VTCLSRRSLIATTGFALASMSLPARAVLPVFYRFAGCGCCHAWTERMRDAGMAVSLQDVDDLAAMGQMLGVPDDLLGCHVGQIDGYVISGHVPPEDIKRLLAERPAAHGLAVPGMPAGSPGMETGGDTEPYQVLLLQADGSTTVFATYG